MMEFPLPPKIIEGQRIRMMARDKRQATELFSLVDNNREFLDRWLPWVKSTAKMEDSISYIELTEMWWKEGTTFDYSVFDKNSEKMIGSFGLHSIDWEKKKCDFGYWIAEAEQGKGYISEAVKLGEKVALDLGFHRLVITCDRLNKRSQSVPKRLGYRLESNQIDECFDHNGRPRDTLLFVKLVNPVIDGKITENLPYGYSIQEVESEAFWKIVQSKQKEIFSNDLIINAREFYSELEREKLKVLSENYNRLSPYFSVVYCHDDAVGWLWGYQDSSESFYMVNSGVLPEHRGRGLYSRLLQVALQKLLDKGYQRIWSRHNNTNNEIITTKLKHGFQITGMELSDTLGSLVHLTYLTNSMRRKVMKFRSGELRPDEELMKVINNS